MEVGINNGFYGNIAATTSTPLWIKNEYIAKCVGWRFDYLFVF